MKMQGATPFREGLVAGFLAATAVVIIFLAYDIATTEALRTPSVLHALLFEGAAAAEQASTEPSRAISYLWFHFAAWFVVGVAAAHIAALTEHYPRLWYWAAVAIAGLLCAFLLQAGIWQVPGLGYHHLWVGAMVGGAVIVTFLAWRHPTLLHANEA